MAINLSVLADLQTKATGLSNLVLVNPQDNKGITAQLATPDKFLFDFEGEQVVELKTETTDHYIENNSAIQDHIAIKPVRIMTTGFVAELNDIAPADLNPAVLFLQEKLTVIAAYTPSLTTTALLAYNAAFQAYQVAALAKSAVQSWGGSTQNKQQKAFQKFSAYLNQRVLFIVQTPWAVYQNMVIESIRAVQSEDTRTVSDFAVTFKQLNFIVSQKGQVQAGESRFFSQADGTVTIGENKPDPSIPSQEKVISEFGL